MSTQAGKPVAGLDGAEYTIEVGPCLTRPRSTVEDVL